MYSAGIAMKTVSPEVDLIGKNSYFVHLLRHQKKYLLILLLGTLIAPAFLAWKNQQPLLQRGESYYYLALLQTFIPGEALYQYAFILPLLLAVASFFLFFGWAGKTKLTPAFTFFTVLFLIMTPAFIHTFTTVSGYAALTFLVLLGLVLLTSSRWYKYACFIPFITAAFIDLLSIIIILFLLGTYYITHRKDHSLLLLLGAVMIAMFIISAVIWDAPLVRGPFHDQEARVDLISDLGSFSGVSFILLLLSGLGIASAWKKKQGYLAYVLLVLLILSYMYNTQTVFLLSLMIVFFAASGFILLFERAWVLGVLKKFTFLVVLLTLLFSTMTYIDRATLRGPSLEELQALRWIEDHTTSDTLVFSDPEDSYLVRYFAQREPFYMFHEERSQPFRANLTATVLGSTYIDTTFPILEENQISVLYVSSTLREKYPADQGLLFVLKNERFKLLYSSAGQEVWMFKKAGVR